MRHEFGAQEFILEKMPTGWLNPNEESKRATMKNGRSF
jgi:hypothetical protein